MSKILKNLMPFDVEIADVGVKIAGAQNYTIPPQDYLRFAASSDTIRELARGELLLNDGGNDVSDLSDAVDILKGWCKQ